MKLLLPLLLALSHIIAADDVGPDYDPDDSEAWEVGYGYYPYRTYQSSDLISPQTRSYAQSPECDDGLYTLLTPRGWSVRAPGPAILDNRGDLIWAKTTTEQAYDLTVQDYKGEKFLTYWVGDDRVRGHGAGNYYILDSSYQQRYKISAKNNLRADLHEMVLTPQGTALITVYEIVKFDLSDIKTFDAEEKDPNYIWDCLFQEIDIATDKLLFQWRASDHHSLNESYHDIGGDGTLNAPWDFYHINSVNKDELGNFIVSARFPHTVSYINGATGDILWRLGGKLNDFKDLSNGSATDFAWQHDARFHAVTQFPHMMKETIADRGRSEDKDGMTTRLVTIFDNSAADNVHDRDMSRGLLIEVTYPSQAASNKREARPHTESLFTARLIKSYEHPQNVVSSSQGSLQVVPSSDNTQDPKILVGYGYNAVWTEFAANGTLLCDTHFATNYSWERGDVQSYRTFKAHWVGRPSYPPSAVLADDGDAVYVSWNGATEVKSYTLQHSSSFSGNDDSWTDLDTVEKNGFENELEFDEDTSMRYLRVQAFDHGGRLLGISKILDQGWTLALVHALPQIAPGSTSSIKILMLFVFNIAAMFVLYELYKRFYTWNRLRRWKARRGIYLMSPTLSDA